VVEYFSYYEAQVIVSFVEQGLSSKDISDLLRSDEEQIILFLKENNLYKEEDKKDKSKKHYTPLMSRIKGSIPPAYYKDKGKTSRRR
jgi:hypothetical protein